MSWPCYNNLWLGYQYMWCNITYLVCRSKHLLLPPHCLIHILRCPCPEPQYNHPNPPIPRSPSAVMTPYWNALILGKPKTLESCDITCPQVIQSFWFQHRALPKNLLQYLWASNVGLLTHFHHKDLDTVIPYHAHRPSDKQLTCYHAVYLDWPLLMFSFVFSSCQ